MPEFRGFRMALSLISLKRERGANGLTYVKDRPSGPT